MKQMLEQRERVIPKGSRFDWTDGRVFKYFKVRGKVRVALTHLYQSFDF